MTTGTEETSAEKRERPEEETNEEPLAKQLKAEYGEDNPSNSKMDLLLQTKSDEAVEKSTLQGKIVALYFSSSWCGACKRFTPLLSVLHDTAQEEDKEFEVVYVSSDDSSESCISYMKEKHGDWLKVSWDQRNRLKMKHGVFAGKEQAEFPDTKRRSGIPTLVIIDKDGEEKELLDCDDEKVLKEIESKGAGFLDRWEKYRW